MMDNQEQYYSPQNRDSASPESGAYVPRPINNDPNEQEYRYAPSPEQQRVNYGEKLHPEQRRRRRRPRGCVLAIVAAVLLLALAISAFGLSVAGLAGMGPIHFGPRVTQSQTFTVNSTSPRIIINDSTGSIKVHTGGSGNVTFQATKQVLGFGGNPNDIKVTYNENADKSEITVNVDESGSALALKTVDFNVTVPSSANLTLHSNTGSINVDGVSGQQSLISNTGSITATNDTLTGPSTLKTNTGSVTFNGSITNAGAYQFESNTGSVSVTTPSGSSYHVDAKTDVGSINSNIQVLSPTRNDVGGELHGDVGNPTGIILTLKTNTGSIDINTASSQP